jgi:hypothetical protein
MQDQKPRIDIAAVKWTGFLVLLATLTAWAISGVLVRARRMKAADTSVSVFAIVAAGSPAKVVVRVEHIAGAELKGTLLQKQNETVYLRASKSSPVVTSSLTPETSVIMGKPQDIVAGAIVQHAGTMDADHVLRADQVVILTGYLHLSQEQGNRP